MSRLVGRICAGLYLAVSLTVTYIAIGSPYHLDNPGLGDLPYFILIGLHFIYGIVLFLTSTEHRSIYQSTFRRRLFIPELLMAAALLFFLFRYIFATNANMDYVQRFISSGGNLRLALDTRTERMLVLVRVFPFVALNLLVYLVHRISSYRVVVASTDVPGLGPDKIIRPWALVLTLGSAFLAAIAMPSFLSLDGYPLLGWFAMVPVFLVLRTTRAGHALFYGVVFGTFHTLISSYWLGTFSLVSLQITVLFFLIYHVIFTPIAVHMHRRARWARVLVFPLAWTLFEYLRSIGFLGYPWALAAHSQFSVIPIIQTASVAGVWGVSFLVLLAGNAVAEVLASLILRLSMERRRAWTAAPVAGSGLWALPLGRSAIWLLSVLVVVGGVYAAGHFWLKSVAPPEPTARIEPGTELEPGARVVRVAQIQQNSDPRKHEYEETLETLEELTDSTLSTDPDLVIWSETALVPNIRRWSVDTSSRRYNRLISDFLDYQVGIDTWLVTGNDDYELVDSPDGTVRLEYNAAVMFSAAGERVETYRKIQLVPFTESFPYREQLPWIYDLLLEFDVHFWEPGEARTVFEHPLVKFSTPICYEDVFPGYVRGFVLEGAQAIFNISNDYWSLTEVQARQHFVAGLFRSVENRRPVLRTTASGLTGQIDIYGRVLQTAPYYEEATLVSDVVIPEEQRTTIYTRFGDYFPIAAGIMVGIIWLSSLSIGGATLMRERAERRAADREAEASGSGAGGTSGPAAGKARGAGAKPGAGAKTRPLQSLGKPLGGRRRRPVRRTKTNWRSIWDK